MSIKAIELLNFEGHKSSYLEFSPGVNIITGLSGHGKSSIVRGINWIFENSPIGDSMISHFSTEKEETIASIEFNDESYISRIRGKSVNEYDISTIDEPLKALKGKVPEAVRKLSNMNEGNIQKQRDFYFMINDSPGKVAKLFNKVSGLEEMDEAISTVNSWHREKSKELSVLTLRYDRVEEKLESLEWIKEADKGFIKSEKVFDSFVEVEKQINPIQQLVDDIVIINEDMDDLADTSAIPAIDKIMEVDIQCDQLDYEIIEIEKLLKSCLELKNDIKGIRLPINSEILKIEGISDEIEDTKDKIASLGLLIKQTEQIEDDLSLAEKKRVIAEDKFNLTLQDCGECPLCGSKT